jgi:diguanylate cyclase (GGDEF)-like protein
MNERNPPEPFVTGVRTETVKGARKRIADWLLDSGWYFIKWSCTPIALLAAAYFRSALLRDLTAALWQLFVFFGISSAAVAVVMFWFTRRTLERRYHRIIADLEERIKMLTTEITDKTRDANTDDITGISNSRAFQEQLPLEFERARTRRKPLAVMVIDLDNFKWVNDKDPSLGDDVLREFATNLCEQCRGTDVVFRYKPGDEFLLMAPETTADPGGRGFANRLRNFFKDYEFRDTDGNYFRITFSAGLAETMPADDPSDTWMRLVARAEAALRRAKQKRNTFEVYTPELDERRRGP